MTYVALDWRLTDYTLQEARVWRQDEKSITVTHIRDLKTYNFVLAELKGKRSAYSRYKRNFLRNRRRDRRQIKSIPNFKK